MGTPLSSPLRFNFEQAPLFLALSRVSFHPSLPRNQPFSSCHEKEPSLPDQESPSSNQSESRIPTTFELASFNSELTFPFSFPPLLLGSFLPDSFSLERPHPTLKSSTTMPPRKEENQPSEVLRTLGTSREGRQRRETTAGRRSREG